MNVFSLSIIFTLMAKLSQDITALFEVLNEIKTQQIFVGSAPEISLPMAKKSSVILHASSHRNVHVS